MQPHALLTVEKDGLSKFTRHRKAQSN